MIAIVDYGVGNLFSLQSSLQKIGAEAVVTGDREALHQAEKIILPGVGAFGDAAEKLQRSGLSQALCEEAAAGKPLLGICLGMQLLFTRSFEYGVHAGLGLIPGDVVAMEGRLPEGYKIPSIGWNSLSLKKPENPLFSGIKDGDYVYFVHSFFAEHCDGDVIATTEYGFPMTAAVARGSVFGCQFHPEKSGNVGLSILKAFCEMQVTK